MKMLSQAGGVDPSCGQLKVFESVFALDFSTAERSRRCFYSVHVGCSILLHAADGEGDVESEFVAPVVSNGGVSISR